MSEINRIFIIGHPGAGKALLAKSIAEKMGWQFIDADSGLEFHVGKTVNEILGDQGEESFYKCEFDILNSLRKKSNIIVATDGSIICSKRIRELLSSEYVVHLKVSTPVQLDRILRNPNPLLPETNIEKFLNQLHENRDHLYKSIETIAINSDDNALDEHVTSIVTKISKNQSVLHSEQLVLDNKDLVFFHKETHASTYLSEQQAFCLKLLAQGKTSKEIARDMNISFRTVENYIAKTADKLGCSSSKELIKLYHDKH